MDIFVSSLCKEGASPQVVGCVGYRVHKVGSGGCLACAWLVNGRQFKRTGDLTI